MGFTARTKSVSGRLRTSHPITNDHSHGSHGYLEILGGGPEISYKSVSGSLRIVSQEGEKIVKREVIKEDTSQPNSHMMILKRVENGEISVEEALAEMKA
jgi:hypothetical protein